MMSPHTTSVPELPPRSGFIGNMAILEIRSPTAYHYGFLALGNQMGAVSRAMSLHHCSRPTFCKNTCRNPPQWPPRPRP